MAMLIVLTTPFALLPFAFSRMSISADSVQLLPEPATWALFIAGLGAVASRRLRRRRGAVGAPERQGLTQGWNLPSNA
jgi:hypothetical protein